MGDAIPSGMATLSHLRPAFWHHSTAEQSPGLRTMDFVLLALLAIVLAFMAQGDMRPMMSQ